MVEEPSLAENTSGLSTTELPVHPSQKRDEPEDSGNEAVAAKPDAKQKKRERLEELKVFFHNGASVRRDDEKSETHKIGLPLTLPPCLLWSKQLIFGRTSS